MIKAKPKLLFYCQHLMGVGHLTRSFAICKELASDYEITFLQGGKDIGKRAPAGVRLIKLPPLQMEVDSNKLFDPIGSKAPAEIFVERGEQIQAELDTSYDFLIVELYPFGRKKFTVEILDLVEKVRARNPRVRVLSSLRDILVEKPDYLTRDVKIARLVQNYFDYVLIHSDPELIRLDATYSQVSAIQDKVIYTGYISETAPNEEISIRREPRILISQGGGIVGAELLQATLDLVDALPHYEFAFIIGPNASASLREQVEKIAATKKHVKLMPFSENFEAELARSSLSISLAGYNTVMNLLHTRTPAVVYPFAGNQEQLLRARLLEERGFVHMITESGLKSGLLLSVMERALNSVYPPAHINLSGTRYTKKFLESLSTYE